MYVYWLTRVDGFTFFPIMFHRTWPCLVTLPFYVALKIILIYLTIHTATQLSNNSKLGYVSSSPQILLWIMNISSPSTSPCSARLSQPPSPIMNELFLLSVSCTLSNRQSLIVYYFQSLLCGTSSNVIWKLK